MRRGRGLPCGAGDAEVHVLVEGRGVVEVGDVPDVHLADAVGGVDGADSDVTWSLSRLSLSLAQACIWSQHRWMMRTEKVRASLQ